jgi:hypothetical protein
MMGSLSSLSTTLNRRSTICLADPAPIDVPPVDLLTYAFEGEKNYDEDKVRRIIPLASVFPQVANSSSRNCISILKMILWL